MFYFTCREAESVVRYVSIFFFDGLLTSGQVFNKNYTQYLPLSVYDLMTWVGSPAIYVVDCSHAGLVLSALSHFAAHLGQEACSKVASAPDPNMGRGPPVGTSSENR